MLKIFYMEIPAVASEKPDWAFFDPRVAKETFEEAALYKNEGVRLRRLLGETMVRAGLKELFDLGEDVNYRILRGEHGKPYLEGVNHVYFNISHSGDYIVCAFSDSQVGIDIEKIACPRYEVARRFFHPEEIRLLENDTLSNKDLFYDIWVVKESFLKYEGTGLTRPLSSFRVEILSDKTLIYEEGKALSLHIQACRVAADYTCYVCTPLGEIPQLMRLEWKDL